MKLKGFTLQISSCLKQLTMNLITFYKKYIPSHNLTYNIKRAMCFSFNFGWYSKSSLIWWFSHKNRNGGGVLLKEQNPIRVIKVCDKNLFSDVEWSYAGVKLATSVKEPIKLIMKLSIISLIASFFSIHITRNKRTGNCIFVTFYTVLEKYL